MRFSFSPALLTFTSLAVLMVAKPATAQIVIGGEPKRPAVEVDLGALEQLAKSAGLDIVPRPAPRPAGSIASSPIAPPRSQPRPLAAAPVVAKPTAPTLQVAQPVRPTAPVVAQPAPRVAAAVPPPVASQPINNQPINNQPINSQPSANTPAPATQIAALAPPAATPAPTTSRIVATPAATRPVAAPPAAAPATSRNGPIRVGYTPGATALTEATRSQISDIVRQLEANSSARVEIAAFASGTPERPSDARRLSLTRALEIRGFLIDSGVRSTRIDVRALGADAQGGPADRVDLTIKG